MDDKIQNGNCDTVTTRIKSGLKFLYEAGNYINSIIRKSADIYNTVFEPLRIIIQPLQQKLSNISVAVTEVFKPIVVANKLGKYQYVIWEYMTPEDIDMFFKSKNVNKTLRIMYEKRKYKMFYDLARECINDIDGNNARILSQAIDSFVIRNYDLCAIGIIIVIDGELSVMTGNNSTNIIKRVEPLLRKLNDDEILSEDEYSLMALYLTVDETMKTFAGFSDFNKDEPAFISRHWTVHGRNERRKTKIDCVKLLRFLYGIMLLNKVGQDESTEFKE